MVHLPDLDEGISDRLSRRRQHATGEVRDRADCRRDSIVDDQQVVIRVEGHLVRVEGPLRCRRRHLQGQGLGEQSRGVEQGDPGARAEAAKELTPRRKQVTLRHLVLLAYAD
jgi:hypothetical protein